MPRAGSPRAKRFLVTGQTKIGSEAPCEATPTRPVMSPEGSAWCLTREAKRGWYVVMSDNRQVEEDGWYTGTVKCNLYCLI